MAKKRSELEEELMTDANIERVIAMLEPKEGKPASKKDCCQVLGMAYNVTRLGNIIETYKNKVAREKERREALRGKPATKDEIAYVISEYLEGESVDAITRSTYRGTTFVKAILEKYSVPVRGISHDYFKPEMIPDGSARSRFNVGEIVWSARYASKARVEAEYVDKNNLGFIYRVWLLDEKWKQYAYTEAFELASLEQFKELGVSL